MLLVRGLVHDRYDSVTKLRDHDRYDVTTLRDPRPLRIFFASLLLSRYRLFFAPKRPGTCDDWGVQWGKVATVKRRHGVVEDNLNARRPDKRAGWCDLLYQLPKDLLTFAYHLHFFCHTKRGRDGY